MAIVTACALTFALSFAVPLNIGFLSLSLISVFVIPPFLWVGVFNTVGAKRAFIIGCMVAGTPHLVLSVYFLIGGFVFGSFSGGNYFDSLTNLDSSESSFIRLVHIVSYGIGLFGGLVGLGSYYFWRDSCSTGSVNNPNSEIDD